jgi:hypothetical protein
MEKIENLNPANPWELRKLMDECDKWDGYSGKNVDGEDVLFFVSKDGITLKTRHTRKPNWYECVKFDSDGNMTEVTYEHI